MVKTGNAEVKAFLEGLFEKPFRCMDSDCGFICPQIMVPFEVTDPIEFWDYDSPECEPRFLEPGIYQLVHHDGGNTSHFIHLEKYEGGNWVRGFCSHAGWYGGHMVDWRGIKLVEIQGALAL